MKASYLCFAMAGALMLGGCANREGVSPSQNSSLQAVSPSTTSTSQGGVMQRGLDSWLKEEWTPLTSTPAPKNVAKPSVTAEPNAVQPSAAQNETAAAVTPTEPKDETPFTLQKYADKWKVYNENKAKMNEGKPKEPSNIEKIESMPIIGK